jgi:tyrosine aminotransferase
MTYDPAGVADSVKAAIIRLSQVIVGCNMIIQTAIPELLYNTPATYFEKHNTQLALHAKTVTEAFQKIPGLTPVTPQGTMYVMVGIDTTVLTDIKDDRDFVQKLLNEEFVFVLPGSAFAYKNYFRVVYAAPVDVLTDATDRIAAFCKRHSAQ